MIKITIIIIIIVTALFLGNFGNFTFANPDNQNVLLENISTVLVENEFGNKKMEGSDVNKFEDAVVYKVRFSKDDLVFDKLMGYDIVKMKDCSYLGKIGEPMIPTKEIMIALPDGIAAKKVRVIDAQSVNIEGEYTIFPTQPPQTVDTSMDETAFIPVPPDSQIYNYNKLYPSNLVELNDQTDLAGQGMAAITIYPIHYVPKEKSLTLITSIEFAIEGVKEYVCGDYLPKNISENGREMYQKMVEEMVINPEDVELVSSEVPQPLGVDPGDYDYVIITTTSWVNAFQSLADWKTKKGIPANIVTTSWIYNNGGYSGTNQQKIRSFIQDAHSNWGTTFFLLGGDTSYVPHYSKLMYTPSTGWEYVTTDTYYSDYDDDWICEVHVGRASVYHSGTSAGGIKNFIDKILTYEKDPPSTNYAKKVALFGFDLDAVTYGEDCKTDIDDLYIPSSWSVTSVYDSHSGNHEDAVDTAVNNGQNLINHIDHSNYNFMGTGWGNHWWGLDTSEVDAFNNGDKQSIWYSIGCWACAYNYSNCIAEHFVRDTDGGGVAFIGNSRYGWYYQGYDDYLSLRYDRYFFRSLFDQGHYKLGDLFSDHKQDAYFSMNQSDYNKYIFTELNLLGDPEMPIWTENPSSFIVTHPNEIPISSSSFTVHVENTVGSNINNAYVCLWKEDEIYKRGYTSSNGDVTFTVSPSTIGTLNVTVTKHNYIPSESAAQVMDAYEPDDIYTEANWIETDNTKQFHNFHVPGDQDWIKFNATFQYTYVIETSDLGPDSDTVLYLYYTDGTTLIDWDDDGGNELFSSRIEWTCPINGIYYAMVKHWNNFTGGPETYYNLSIVIEEKSKVCGFVTDSVTGEPIEDADVYLSWHDNQGHYDWNHTYTDSFGFYSMNVAAGEMKLEAYADGYFSNDTEWYVIGENETLCVNISLDPRPPENSVVCGYVTDELSGDPIEDAWVDLDWRDDQGHYYWNYTYTNSSGFYSMNVAAGEIYLYVGADGYFSEWTGYYDVGEYETLWLNVSLDPLPPQNSVVCGFVTNESDGSPIEDAWVDLYWQDDQGHWDWNYTYTDSSGFYSMNVAAGEIDLYFWADGYFSEWTDYYDIGDYETLWINMSLYPKPPENSVVCGYVTDSLTGDPIDNAEIKLYWEDDLGHYYTNYTYSNISGFYTVNTASGTVHLRIDADGYYREYTDYYNIGDNETLWINVLLDPRPPQNSVVCGFVTNESDGSPIEDAWVDLYWQDDQGHWNWNNTYTDSSGFYSMNVAAGEIYLYFWADGYFSEWTGYYDVGEYETLWLNVSLDPLPPQNSVVCGYVTDELSGDPIEDAWVSLDWQDDQGHWDWNYTYTDSSGFYTMNVAAGFVDLYIEADGYFYEHTNLYEIDENEILWMNISLHPKPSENSIVCGFVTDGINGTPINNAVVGLDWYDDQWHYDWNYTYTNSSGFYSMNVAAGKISLYVYAGIGYTFNGTSWITIGENESIWINFTLEEDVTSPIINNLTIPTYVGQNHTGNISANINDKNLQQVYMTLSDEFGTTFNDSFVIWYYLNDSGVNDTYAIRNYSGTYANLEQGENSTPATVIVLSNSSETDKIYTSGYFKKNHSSSSTFVFIEFYLSNGTLCNIAIPMISFLGSIELDYVTDMIESGVSIVTINGMLHSNYTLFAIGNQSNPFLNWSLLENGEYKGQIEAYDKAFNWNFETFNFTVMQPNNPPNKPSNPAPSDSATGIGTSPTLSVYVSDPDGDTMEVSFYNAADDSLIGTNSAVPSDNIASVAWSGRSYSTTYSWYAIANDTLLDNKSDTWNFTTKSSNGGTGGGGGGFIPPTPTNQNPTADASAGEPYRGYINSEITFDGSNSSDPDGTIVNWTWDFGDGTNGTGDIITHTYSSPDTYLIVLTVSDDEGAEDTYETTAVISQPNRIPSAPDVDGPQDGTQNTEYTYTAVSIDEDNDTIQYHFDWGDGTENTTEFLTNGTVATQKHIWTAAGKYTIAVQAYDNQTPSDTTRYTVLIDAHIVKDIGYITDDDADGTYDTFHGENIETELNQEDGKYLIDTNGDGEWNYTYDLVEGLAPYQKGEEIEIPWIMVAGIVIAIAVIAIIVYLYKKEYF